MRLIDADTLQYSDARDMLPTGQYITREEIEKAAEPIRRGHWKKSGHWGRVYKCDQCGHYLDFDGVNAGRGSTNYCPNCGAKMGEEENT